MSPKIDNKQFSISDIEYTFLSLEQQNCKFLDIFKDFNVIFNKREVSDTFLDTYLDDNIKCITVEMYDENGFSFNIGYENYYILYEIAEDTQYFCLETVKISIRYRIG